LLFATRDDIMKFVKKNNIKYREDSSNISGTYIRNAIRNRLIPIAKELYPDATGSVDRHMKRLRGVEQIYRSHLDEVKKELVREQDDMIKIDIEKLLSFQNPELYLFELLYPYGFSGDIIAAILKTAGKQAGKVFFSESHRVVKDRNCFMISAIPTRKQLPEFHVNAGDTEISSPLLMRFTITDAADNASFICAENRAYFDFDKISFPLTVRKWKAGDYMYPFGLKGRKKLVDVFKDHKLSLIEKENIWLLCNKNDIIWVIGLRSDNRYRISAKTRKVFSAEWCR
jgi:tRNA(Ile)-lysidine synthase